MLKVIKDAEKNIFSPEAAGLSAKPGEGFERLPCAGLAVKAGTAAGHGYASG